MDLVIRPLHQTLSDYNALAAIHQAAWGEVWLDGAAMQAALATRQPAPTLLTATTREDQGGALAMLAKYGFVQVMRSPMALLPLRFGQQPSIRKAVCPSMGPVGIT